MGKDLKGRELGVGIKQRKNGSYEARYTDAYGVRRSIYTQNLKDARKILLDKQYEKSHRICLKDEKMTLDEWFAKWITTYKKNTIKQSSLKLYRYTYEKYISPELGKAPLSKITKISIQDLINNLNENGYSWATQDKVKRILNDMFGRAIEDDFCIKNPVRGIRLLGDKGHYKVLTKEEQSMFFETAAGTFYENLFVVAVNTGLRPGELFALTKHDIDFIEKVIRVRNNLVYMKYDGEETKNFHWETPKTKSSIRDVPINKICEEYLRKQLVLKNKLKIRFPNDSEFSEVIFVSNRNNPLNSAIYDQAIHKIINERNLLLDPVEELEPFGGHTFRHTFATRCIESGVKPKTLQSYLGHATLEMTMNLYVHTMDDVKQDEIGLLNETNNNIYRFVGV